MTEPSPGVPLAHYIDQHPEVDVELNCTVCGRGRVLPMAGVVRRLTARGLDARATGVREIAAIVQEDCSCGVRKWESRPHRPPPKMGASAETSAAAKVEEMNQVAANYRAAKGR